MIDTNRLTLIPLTANQLNLWVNDITKLENELNCKYAAEPMEGFFRDIVNGQAAKAQSDEANYLFHTFWLIIRKSDGIAVGSFGFKDIPNNDQEVEIGYGLGKVFEGNGYITESIQALYIWSKSQDGISYLIAETEPDNPQSENVLKRCGFVLHRQEENGNSWWRL